MNDSKLLQYLQESVRDRNETIKQLLVTINKNHIEIDLKNELLEILSLLFILSLVANGFLTYIYFTH